MDQHILKIVAAVAILIAINYPIALFVNYLKDRFDLKEDIPLRDTTAILGILERGLYLIALINQKDEFIILWLGLKVAGGWQDWQHERENGNKNRGRFNIFMIGNALSIFSVYIIFRYIL